MNPIINKVKALTKKYLTIPGINNFVQNVKLYYIDFIIFTIFWAVVTAYFAYSTANDFSEISDMLKYSAKSSDLFSKMATSVLSLKNLFESFIYFLPTILYTFLLSCLFLRNSNPRKIPSKLRFILLLCLNLFYLSIFLLESVNSFSRITRSSWAEGFNKSSVISCLLDNMCNKNYISVQNNKNILVSTGDKQKEYDKVVKHYIDVREGTCYSFKGAEFRTCLANNYK